MLDVVISDMAPRTMGTSLCRDLEYAHFFHADCTHLKISIRNAAETSTQLAKLQRADLASDKLFASICNI